MEIVLMVALILVGVPVIYIIFQSIGDRSSSGSGAPGRAVAPSASTTRNKKEAKPIPSPDTLTSSETLEPDAKTQKGNTSTVPGRDDTPQPQPSIIHPPEEFEPQRKSGGLTGVIGNILGGDSGETDEPELQPAPPAREEIPPKPTVIDETTATGEYLDVGGNAVDLDEFGDTGTLAPVTEDITGTEEYAAIDGLEGGEALIPLEQEKKADEEETIYDSQEVETPISAMMPDSGASHIDDEVIFEETEEEEENEPLVDRLASADKEKDVTSPASVASFSAYAPKEVIATQRHSLFVYAHTEALKTEVEADIARFQREFGDEVPTGRSAKNPVMLTHGTPITVVPECDELTFDPPELTKTWHGDWTRYSFDFRPREEDIDETLFVRVGIQVAGIEIASIKTAVDVMAAPQEQPQDSYQLRTPVLNTPLDNPLADAKFNSETTAPYHKIFISYSRRDSKITRAYKLAQQAIGNDAFLDVDDIRAGEDWRAALATAIDEADIFQLFWSKHSAASKYCAYEWQYALTQKCPENRCVGFIRPVFWEDDRPSPPEELKHLNFVFIPFADDEDEETQ